MNAKTIGYWITTGLFAAVLGFSGIAHVMHLEFMVENMAELGYPPYVLTILGPAKLAGLVVLLVPGWPLLKEWAYAGFAFDLIGAVASHLFSGDPFAVAVRPALVLGFGAASYLLRPEARRLAASLAARITPSNAPEPAGATAAES